MNIRLSVNLNKVALIRNSRDGQLPDLTQIAEIAFRGGADGLTMHPRPDARHATTKDIALLSKICQKHKKELNVEGNPLASSNKQSGYPGYFEIVEKYLPNQCTLVPDNPSQKTSDHGWDVKNDFLALEKAIKRLKKIKTRISIFMDVENSNSFGDLVNMGADCVELYTESYNVSFLKTQEEYQKVFLKYCEASEKAHLLGLEVNAGHGLNLSNLRFFRKLPHLSEVSICHALISEALIYVLWSTVKSYKTLLTSDVN